MTVARDRKLKEAPLLVVEDLSKHFRVYGRGMFRRQVGTVKAVDNISFSVLPGETLGLVGETGSGKTTAARCILRAMKPTSGSMLFRQRAQPFNLSRMSERELRPLRPQMQMIFKDPFSTLNPRMTVGEILAEPLIVHGLATGEDLVDRVEEMLGRVGLPSEAAAMYPHGFSAEERQRIGIARALVMKPSLVVVDEVVSALDVWGQAGVIDLLRDLRTALDLTYIFITSDLNVARQICDRVAVMYAGKIVEMGPAKQLLAEPQHPYTRELLAATPSLDPDEPITVAAEAADPTHLPGGCTFHPPSSYARAEDSVPPSWRAAGKLADEEQARASLAV